MDEQKLLAERFEANCAHLRGVAYRMLGSSAEADDAVQEAWLRLARSDTDDVANLRGWLTTVTARVCLDMLRTRKSRREDAMDAHAPDLAAPDDAEQDQAVADSVGLAMLVVLEALAPAERVAFVLHDMFDVPFDEIAPIVGRSSDATRQLASRARRRVQGGDVKADRERQREVVSAFLAAARGNDFTGLLAVLDPNVMLRADAAAVAAALANAAHGAPKLAPKAQGAHVVAEAFKGRAKGARLALIDGDVGAVFAPGGRPFTAFLFTVRDGRVAELEVVNDPERIAAMDITPLRE